MRTTGITDGQKHAQALCAHRRVRHGLALLSEEVQERDEDTAGNLDLIRSRLKIAREDYDAWQAKIVVSPIRRRAGKIELQFA
jgi:hypothetical protein